jgi:hypothetical protein
MKTEVLSQGVQHGEEPDLCAAASVDRPARIDTLSSNWGDVLKANNAYADILVHEAGVPLNCA